MVIVESENKNLYLMTRDKSDLISISTETINNLFSCYEDNIKSDSITAQIFVKSKPDGDFEESDMQKIDDEVQDCFKYSKSLKINNWKSENENDGFKDIYSIKILFQAEKTNGEKLSFEIMVRKNKHEDIIIEKLNPETNEFDLVKSKVALGGFGNGIVYVITDIINNLNYNSRRYSTFLDEYKNYLDEKNVRQNDILVQNSGIDTRHRVQYNGSDVYRYDLIRRSAMNSVATQDSAYIRNKESSGEILDLISNHIGKIIIFLLSLVILGIVWYLNLVSLQIGLTALAVCLALFVGIAIWDQKKKRLPKPKKIWTGFCSYLGFACCKQKEGGRVPSREMDRNKNRF